MELKTLTLEELLKDLDAPTQRMIESIIITLRDMKLLDGQSINWRHGNEVYGIQCSLERFKRLPTIAAPQGISL